MKTEQEILKIQYFPYKRKFKDWLNDNLNFVWNKGIPIFATAKFVLTLNWWWFALLFISLLFTLNLEVQYEKPKSLKWVIEE